MSANVGPTLSSFLTPRRLREMAGGPSYDRGKKYFLDGAVRSPRADGGGIRAVVRGTYDYRVRLRIADGDLEYDCTCPVGMRGEFCKHCVAAALAWNDRSADAEDAAGQSQALTPADLRAFLLGLDKEELATMLLEQAEEDDRLRRRLEIRAANAAPGAVDHAVWRGAFDEALGDGGLIPYGEVYEFVSGIDEVIDTLDQLLRSGKAEDVVQLAEYALEQADAGVEYIDDSDGYMVGIMDRLHRLHLEACRQARPDPVSLAERLFEAEMESDYDVFYNAAAVYADVLGDEGLAAYRRLARAEWDKVPPLQPGSERPSDYYGNRSRITSIMQAWARADGDFDLLVEIKTRDLSTPSAFRDLADLYKDAGDRDRALEWAERGWEAFRSARANEELRTFLTDEYQRRGRHGDALALVWEAFEAQPSLHRYADLERRAKRAKQWPGWRDKALALIRDKTEIDRMNPAPRPSFWSYGPPFRDHSLPVEIFLYEGDADAAWAEAEAGGCTAPLLLKLAERREESHPDDSLRVYRAHVEALLRNTGNHAYEKAVEYLERIAAITDRTGQSEAFTSYLAAVRADHKRKRNLMKLMDARGW